ncbi:alpha-2,8-polysialyltransferase family protein [Cupriavidus gilardii]|uniref:alpha-2,8-polysialyltransferase family protein n=1 Tax=Cupriavidus gilardii TaxID=82541 RepID=UPI0021B258E6|nr:alpha-2,8-polysialyltransferase family protein [Cupriavidus gilardii]UXC36803.1 alpha-2,8-polysialyltransferase family protein [Cupriavidus gilardii]
MSKLRKLLFKPGAFFRDMLKKRGFICDFPSVDAENLFVVSHLGQLHQVQSLIRFERTGKNYLVVLSTNANRSVPKAILNQVDRRLFLAVRECRLPLAPNKIDIPKLLRIAAIYRGLLNSTAAHSLYLLSFERHYAMLAQFARRRGLHVNLIEEGTATYKFANDGSNMAAIGKVGGIREQCHAFLIENLPVFSAIRPALGAVKAFDRAYVAFPSLIGGGFSVEETRKFFLHAGGMTVTTRVRSLVEKYKIGSEDIIYVNQRYSISHDIFCLAILQIFDGLKKRFRGRIFVKFHPKDSPALLSRFRKMLSEHTELEERVVIIHEADFLIEPAVSVAMPRGIIGIASTALVYGPLVSPDTEVYSCGRQFIDIVRAISGSPADEKGCAVIEEHLRIITRFSHVKELGQYAETDGRQLDHKSFGSAIWPDNTFYMLFVCRQWQDAKKRLDEESDESSHADPARVALELRMIAELEGLCGIADFQPWNQAEWMSVTKKALSAYVEERFDDVLIQFSRIEPLYGHSAYEASCLWAIKAAVLRRLDRALEAEAFLYSMEQRLGENPIFKLEMARCAVMARRWEKALCYIKWTFPSDGPDFPEEVALMQLEALWHLGRHEERESLLVHWGENRKSKEITTRAIQLLQGKIADSLKLGRKKNAANYLQLAQKMLRPLGLSEDELLYESTSLKEAILDEAGILCVAEKLRSEEIQAEIRLKVVPILLNQYLSRGAKEEISTLLDELELEGVDSSTLLIFRCWYSAAEGEWSQVISMLVPIIEGGDPGGFGSLIYRATLLLSRAYRETGKLDEARVILRQFEKLGYADTLLRMEVIRLAFMEQRWHVVIKQVNHVFNSAYDRMPIDVAQHFLLAVEVTASPVEAYNTAVELRNALPGSADLAQCELELALKTGSRCAVVNALDAGKEWQFSHLWPRLRAHRWLGEIEVAYRLIKLSGTARPSSFDECLLLAEICFLAGDIDEAIGNYMYAIRNYPGIATDATMDRLVALKLINAVDMSLRAQKIGSPK